MTNATTKLDSANQLLTKLVDQMPDDWALRKKVAQVLYDAGFYLDASQMVWSAPEIPPVGDEVVFAAKIVAKGQPTRAMRLINAVIENNVNQPEESLTIAKLFMKAGMPLLAVRMYSAAAAIDSKLIDSEFELSLIRTDVEALAWNDEVMSEDFPWDGPEVVEAADEEETKDAHEALLNGLTEPVPIKAAVSGTEKEDVTSEDVTSAEPEPERRLPVWQKQEGRAISDPNKMVDDEPEPSVPITSDVEPPAHDENLVEFYSKPMVESKPSDMYAPEVK